MVPPPSFSENRAVYEIMWKSRVEPDRPAGDNIIRRVRSAFWITKDTHKREYVILIAFPRQGRLCERSSMLRHTHGCLVDVKPGGT